jgi:hypothetical protein
LLEAFFSLPSLSPDLILLFLMGNWRSKNSRKIGEKNVQKRMRMKNVTGIGRN